MHTYLWYFRLELSHAVLCRLIQYLGKRVPMRSTT